jgi:two-component system phosphate regulon sensor histidine kinase PhoR
MLSEDPGRRLDAGQRQMVAAIDRGASRLRGLIEDVFTLAKLESGAFGTPQQPVGLSEVIAAAVEEVQPSVADHQQVLTVTGGGPGLVVNGDRSQLERVMINLLTNAVKFTPAGGRVTVGTGARDGSAVITVSDTGIGIPQRDQEKLFTRFFRAANAIGREIPGSGLGLAIVATIVTSHGGSIAVRSREGTGTTFTIELPLRVPAPAQAG